MARTNQSYSEVFKREAVALVAAETSVTEVAREAGIPSSSPTSYVAQFSGSRL